MLARSSSVLGPRAKRGETPHGTSGLHSNSNAPDIALPGIVGILGRRPSRIAEHYFTYPVLVVIADGLSKVPQERSRKRRTRVRSKKDVCRFTTERQKLNILWIEVDLHISMHYANPPRALSALKGVGGSCLFDSMLKIPYSIHHLREEVPHSNFRERWLLCSSS